jgi:hypothetical protein
VVAVAVAKLVVVVAVIDHQSLEKLLEAEPLKKAL